MVISQKANIIYQSGEVGGLLIGFDPLFPVLVTENVMYSFTDYITEIGSRLSIFLAIVGFLSQRILYPVVTRELGDSLNDQEVNSISANQSADEQKKRKNIVNKYLNWTTILSQMIKTDNHNTKIKELERVIKD